MKNSEIRPHPYIIFESLPRFAVFSLLPFLQSVLTTPLWGSAWRSLFWALVPVLPALMLYASVRYIWQDGEICLRRGIFLRRDTFLRRTTVCAAQVPDSVTAFLVGARILKIATPAGERRMIVTKSRVSSGIDWKKSKTVPPIQILAAVAAWSDPASGLLFLSLTFRRAGDLLGEEFSRPIHGAVQMALNAVPDTVAMIGVLLAAGWAAALARDFWKYARFTLWLHKGWMLVTRGIVPKQREYLKINHVHAVVYRQTSLSLLFRRGTLSLYPPGSRKKGDIHFLFPQLCRDPFPPSKERPPVRAIASYLTLPAVWLAAAGLLIFLPQRQIFSKLLWPLLLPAVWFMWIRLSAWRKAGIAVKNGRVYVRGFQGMDLYAASIPLKEIRQIRLTQSLFQRIGKNCTVKISCAAGQTFFTVKQIPLERAQKILAPCFIKRESQ